MTFEEVQKEFAPLVRAVVGRLVPATDAADVDAEVWLSVFTALQHFDGRSSVKTYLYTIIKRRVADFYRERYREGRLLQEAWTRAQEAQLAPGEPGASIVMPTAGELRILRALADGRGNDDIAQALHLSKHTVRSHVKALYRKLKLRNRGELVLFAHRFLGGES